MTFSEHFLCDLQTYLKENADNANTFVCHWILDLLLNKTAIIWGKLEGNVGISDMCVTVSLHEE